MTIPLMYGPVAPVVNGYQRFLLAQAEARAEHAARAGAQRALLVTREEAWGPAPYYAGYLRNWATRARDLGRIEAVDGEVWALPR